MYDLRGAVVKDLVRGSLAAGRHVVTWNGVREDGQHVPTGIYLIDFTAGDVRETRKAMLIR